MSSGYQAYINLVSADAAEASLKFLLLHNAQQFRSKFERDVAVELRPKRAYPYSPVQSVRFFVRSAPVNAPLS